MKDTVFSSVKNDTLIPPWLLKQNSGQIIVLWMNSLFSNPVLAVFLRAQVPERQRGHARRD